MEIIRKLNREQGVTVILVTHEADVGAYADRLIVMRDGQIASDEHQTAAADSHASNSAIRAAGPGGGAAGAPCPHAHSATTRAIPFMYKGLARGCQGLEALL